MNWIKDKVLPKFKAFVKTNSSEETLWIKCKSCEQMIFHKEHLANFNVCKFSLSLIYGSIKKSFMPFRSRR